MAPTPGSVLEDLRTKRSALYDEIQKLVAERNKLYDEFRAQVDGEGRPSEDEIARFDVRRNHEDEAVRPTEEEIRAFDERVNSGPSDEDVSKFNSAHAERRRVIDEKLEQLDEYDRRLGDETRLANSRRTAEEASRGLPFEHIEAQRDPMTYRMDNQGQYSYFLDLAAMQNMEVRSTPDPRLEGFRERLDRHAKEMADVLPQRWARRKAMAEERVERAEDEFRGRIGVGRGGLEVSPFERQAHLRSLAPEARGDDYEMRAPSRIVGQGGLLTLAAA